MNYSKISVRYAKALFQIGKDNNLLDVFNKDVRFISEVLLIPEMTIVIHSPVIQTSQKKNLFEKIFAGQVHANVSSFLRLILDNRREVNLKDILRNFSDSYKKYRGITTAYLTTATTIDLAVQQKVKDVVKGLFHNEVELFQNVDENIIGGYILRIDDKQIDASVASKLSKLKRNLINTSFEYKLPIIK